MKNQSTHDNMGIVSRCIKRFIDIVFSLLGILLLWPIFLIIAIALKRQHNGPVLFHQERIGYKGRPFNIIKFRTMSMVMEDNGPRLVAHCEDVDATPVERFLRSHHLDELPQLWNVLKGEMSIVGPRPERQFFINKIMEHTDRYPLIYEMRPGLTSEATLYNGYTDTMEKMLRRLDMDISYLERRTLWLDFKIAAKTVISIVTGKKI